MQGWKLYEEIRYTIFHHFTHISGRNYSRKYIQYLNRIFEQMHHNFFSKKRCKSGHSDQEQKRPKKLRQPLVLRSLTINVSCSRKFCANFMPLYFHELFQISYNRTINTSKIKRLQRGYERIIVHDNKSSRNKKKLRLSFCTCAFMRYFFQFLYDGMYI